MNQVGLIKPTILYGFGSDAEVNGTVTAADGTTSTLDGGVTGQEYDDGMIQLVADYDNGAGMKAPFAYANYVVLVLHQQFLLHLMLTACWWC